MQEDRLHLIVKMLEKNPDDSFLNYAAALEFKKNSNFSKAIELLELLINKDENYLASYYQLGKLYEASGQIQNAINIYKKGLEIAKSKSDSKTLGELSEALMIIEDE